MVLVEECQCCSWMLLGCGAWRIIAVFVIVAHLQPHKLAHFTLGTASTEVSSLEIVQVGGMDAPEVAFAIGCTARLDEAIVQRQIVSDGIAPPGTTTAEVWVMVKDVLIDI